jgi:hypothetical protein
MVGAVYPYPDDVIPGFLDANADVLVDGGPFDVPGWFTGGWFNDDVATLADYVEKKYPPYGVIVRPVGSTNRVLVWYDAGGKLHVVDVTGHTIANEVAKAPYESPDSGYLESLMNRINEIAKGLPSPGEALGDLTLIVGGVALIMVLQTLRK